MKNINFQLKRTITNNNLRINSTLNYKINSTIIIIISPIDYLKVKNIIKILKEDYGFFKNNTLFYVSNENPLNIIIKQNNKNFKYNVYIIYSNLLTLDNNIKLDQYCINNNITCFSNNVLIPSNNIINYSSHYSSSINAYTLTLNHINSLLSDTNITLNKENINYTHALIVLEDNDSHKYLANVITQLDLNVTIDNIVFVNSFTDNFTDYINTYLSNQDTINTHFCVFQILNPLYLFNNINTINNKNVNLEKRFYMLNSTFINVKPMFNINAVIGLQTNIYNYEKFIKILNTYNTTSINKLLKIGTIIDDIIPIINKMNKNNISDNLISNLKNMHYVGDNNVWYNEIMLYIKYSNNITYNDEGILFTMLP